MLKDPRRKIIKWLSVLFGLLLMIYCGYQLVWALVREEIVFGRSLNHFTMQDDPVAYFYGLARDIAAFLLGLWLVFRPFGGDKSTAE